jgi:hypothetical protein
MEVSGQLQTPATLSPGKGAPVLIRYDAGWASEPLSGIELRSSSPQSVIVLTELPSQ